MVETHMYIKLSCFKSIYCDFNVLNKQIVLTGINMALVIK